MYVPLMYLVIPYTVQSSRARFMKQPYCMDLKYPEHEQLHFTSK